MLQIALLWVRIAALPFRAMVYGEHGKWGKES